MDIVQGRPVQFPLTAHSRDIFESIIISRFSVRNDDEEVLRTKRGLAYLPHGRSCWRFSLQNDVVLEATNASPDNQACGRDVPASVTVPERWLTPEGARTAGIAVRDGGNANVFQEFGVVLVPEKFAIPVIEATCANVGHYGLTLVADGEVFELVSDDYDLILAHYEYGRNYRRDFLTEASGGGGYFVETHDFPHLHAPLSPDCGGCILIGRRCADDALEFTGFRIPYGYALLTPANTIHGDGTIVGDNAITVAHTSALADTVLFYNENTGQMAADAVRFD